MPDDASREAVDFQRIRRRHVQRVLRPSAQVAAGSTIDLYDPGQLSFVLPDGYSIESVSGFQSPVPTSATPEPRYLGLLALMSAVLAGRWILAASDLR